MTAAALGAGFAASTATGATRHHAGGLLLKAAAQYLQIDRAELHKDVRSGQTLAQIAQAKGKSVSGLEGAMVAAVKTKLDAAVTAGKITAAREQVVLARVQKAVHRLVSAKLSPHPAGKARLLSLAAKYLGVKPKVLAAELNGKSLAQVAAAHGKTAAGLKAALLQPFKARLDKAVAAGRISSTDAAAKLAKISARLDQLISKTR